MKASYLSNKQAMLTLRSFVLMIREIHSRRVSEEFGINGIPHFLFTIPFGRVSGSAK
jgi:hypothetical protein